MGTVQVTKLWVKDAQSILIASLDMTVLFTIFGTSGRPLTPGARAMG